MDSTAHDTSSAPDLSTLISHLNDAVTAAWPSTKPTYNKVKVLLMSWEKDDLDMDVEIKPLASILQGLYHFNTEMWKIPIRRPAAELARKISSVLEADGKEGNLVIFYYGGHARANEQVAGRPVWFANRTAYSPFLKSSVLHSQLANVACDVLLLYDAPHAVQAGEPFTGTGIIETLAASPLDTKSQPIHDTRAFTQSLVQELAHAAHTQEGLSVVELHRRLLCQQQTVASRVSFTDDTYSVVQLDRQTGQPIIEPARQKMPTHHLLASKPRTTVLAPLQRDTDVPNEEPLVLLHPPTLQPDKIPDGPDVLVACRIRDQAVDVEKWKQWLQSVPDAARGITITAVYPGFSLLLLVRMPVVVWDLLPSSPGVSFVGCTTRRDLEDISCIASPGSRLSNMVGGATEVGKSKQLAKLVPQPADRTFHIGSRESNNLGPRTSKWPETFNTHRTETYPAEEVPHCVLVSELLSNDDTTKTERIIKEFTQDVGDPAGRYICNDIQTFVGPAEFEDLLGGSDNEISPLVAMVDERLAAESVKFLNQRQLLGALLPSTENTEAFLKTEDKDILAEKRRLIYITNLNPWSTLALAATASQNQAFALRDFVHKHITFQPAMGVEINSTGSHTFQLYLHLPYLAWRDNLPAFADTRELRDHKDVTFLSGEPPVESHLYEAQISVMVTGVGDKSWTAHAFLDTYHDGGESRHDVQFYEDNGDANAVDPLTGMERTSPGVVDAREYFLRVMQASVGSVKGEWLNAGCTLVKRIKGYMRQDLDRPEILKMHHHAIQVSEQLQQGLAGTIRAWQKFRDLDLAYFDPATKSTTDIIENIDKDIRQLTELRHTLAEHTAMFDKFTASLFTLESGRKVGLTNLLIAAGLCLLSFAVTALISISPATLDSPLTLMQHLFRSAFLAAFVAGVLLVITHWERAKEIALGVEDRFGELGRVEIRRFEIPGIDTVKLGITAVDTKVRGHLKEAWKKWYWPSPRDGYQRLLDEFDVVEEEECCAPIPM